MTKRAAMKRQTREGVFDSRSFSEDSKVRRLPTSHGNHAGHSGHGGWSPNPSNDDRGLSVFR